MLTLIKKEAKATKYILYMFGLFLVFLGLYVFLDFEGNENYNVMYENFGGLVVATHIIINFMIASLSSLLLSGESCPQKAITIFATRILLLVS